MLFSGSLRVAGRTSIKVLSNLFGLPGELYYPKGYNSGRGGYDDEIIYNDEPDWTGKFLAPFVFAGSEKYYGGIFDELNGDEKAIYFDDTMNIPINSLVVFNMPAGNQLYRVYDLQSNNDDLGHIYIKAIVVPITKDNIHTQYSKELSKEYVADKIDEGVNIDNSTDEFLRDLMGQDMAELEEYSTQTEKEIIETNKKSSNDKIIDIEDLL